ncbi:MAG TPA: AIR synthase-related protein [Candidatus Brocadiia bacterium]|nr:AIR synthase-related protein [Candidatus Brocadiia bacterium]
MVKATLATEVADFTPDNENSRDIARMIEGAMKRTFDHRVIESTAVPGAAFAFGSRMGIFAEHYREPVLMGAASGVGPKQQLAIGMGRHDMAGAELVAVGVNELCARAAQPLFFMSYMSACGVEPQTRAGFYDGVGRACSEARCVFLGGDDVEGRETMRPGEYDVVGFTVGAAERGRMIPPELPEPGDAIIGIASNGVHNAGYESARETLMDKAGLSVRHPLGEYGIEGTVCDELLRPTRMYAEAVRAVISAYKVKRVVSGLAHAREGGLIAALRSLLRPGLDADVRRVAWETPRIFDILRDIGGIPPDRMFSEYNMGIGFLVAIRPEFAGAALERLSRSGFRAWRIGEMRAGTEQAHVE